MKIASLELDPKEAGEETVEAREIERPRYSYGTCLHLDETALKKLGIKELPEVGQELHIVAVGKVTGTSENEYEGGSHKCLDIQLTDMGCEYAEEGDDDEPPMSRAARKLYPGGEED